MAGKSRRRGWRRYSESERRRILSEYRSSGLSQAKFARKRGMSVWTLRKWLAGADGVAEGSDRPRLVLVKVESAGVAFPGLSLFSGFEVTLCNGCRLRIPSGFDAGEVRVLVEILERPC